MSSLLLPLCLHCIMARVHYALWITLACDVCVYMLVLFCVCGIIQHHVAPQEYPSVLLPRCHTRSQSACLLSACGMAWHGSCSLSCRAIPCAAFGLLLEERHFGSALCTPALTFNERTSLYGWQHPRNISPPCPARPGCLSGHMRVWVKGCVGFFS